ncbi:unnamed protein product, partial [Sphacelaria rigidula]
PASAAPTPAPTTLAPTHAPTPLTGGAAIALARMNDHRVLPLPPSPLHVFLCFTSPVTTFPPADVPPLPTPAPTTPMPTVGPTAM